MVKEREAKHPRRWRDDGHEPMALDRGRAHGLA
jgi:hypothetical protein